MATKAAPVRLGPFAGGLNTYSDPSSIGDDEAVELTNVDIVLDGGLQSRTPIVRTRSFTDGGAFRKNFKILGTYISPAGKEYVIFTCINAVGGGNYTSYYNVTDDIFGDVTNTFIASAMVKYQNKLWLVSPTGGAGPGGSWDGTTFTAVAAMPRGSTATVYKERMFIGTGILDTNPSRVYFSNPANFTTWTVTDFFDVHNGDEQPIVKLYTHNNSVLIFKSKSTFAFGYETAPTKGQVQLINSGVGIENVDCLEELDSNLYVLFENNVYAINNWNWTKINVKVPLRYSNTVADSTTFDYSVSVIENKIVVRFFAKYYVYNTDIQAWSTWETAVSPHKFYKLGTLDPLTNAFTYYAGTYSNDAEHVDKLCKMQTQFTLANSETFTIRVRTKYYSMDMPFTFKRLMWWGINAIGKSNVNVKATPVVYGTAVRWNDPRITSLSWAQINAAGGTWRTPIATDYSVLDSVDARNIADIKTFIRFVRSLRFREIQFEVSTTVDGTTNTGPFKLQDITAFVANKQLVPAKIN